MFKSKRTIAMVLAVIVSLGLTTYGTLAYLTDSESVVNTFTVGKVNITVDETPVTPDGQPVEGEPGEEVERVKANEYHLMPGHTYSKDPTTTVIAGSEESYVRMTVTLNKLAELKAIEAFGGEAFALENLVAGLDPQLWIPGAITTDDAANTVTYEFRYHQTVDASEATEDIVLEPLFNSVAIPGEVTGDELATLADMEILINGHAIQSLSFADEDAAWAAFDAQVADTTALTAVEEEPVIPETEEEPVAADDQ